MLKSDVHLEAHQSDIRERSAVEVLYHRDQFNTRPKDKCPNSLKIVKIKVDFEDMQVLRSTNSRRRNIGKCTS